MGRKHPSTTTVSEDELHAYVDGQLPANRRREVAAYLDVHLDAAERVTDYLRQRTDMALLGQCLAEALAATRPV